MRRSFLGRVVPALLTVAGVGISSATAGVLILRAMPSPQPSSSGVVSTGTQSAPKPTSTTAPAATGAPIKTAPKPTSTAVPTATPAVSRTVSGQAAQYQFGQIQTKVTVKNGKITNVSAGASVSDQRSAFIDQQAIPMLKRETLQAQSANIDLISGATLTSEAYIQSLQSALQTAGI